MFRLNQLESVSRRGFIGGGVALGLIALKGASKAAGTTESLAEDDILAFVRTFNTTAVSLFASANYVGDYENKKGFLWVGSDCGGLSWFDGHRFHSYSERNGLPTLACFRLPKIETAIF